MPASPKCAAGAISADSPWKPRPSSRNAQPHATIVKGQIHFDCLRLRVTDGIGQRLLADSQEVGFDIRTQASPLSRDLDGDRGISAQLLSDFRQGAREIVVLQSAQAKVPHAAPGLGQAAADKDRARSSRCRASSGRVGSIFATVSS